MTRLVDYGPVLFAYSGIGSVEYEGGSVRQVSFEAGQISTGKILILASTLPDRIEDVFRAMLDPREPVRFVGETSTGERLVAEAPPDSRGPSIWSAYVGQSPEGRGICEVIRSRQLRVEIGQVRAPSEYRFGFTNAPDVLPILSSVSV